ncbi:MAG: serine/threonine protein kinase [Moorea sp. SIO3C2]|nr:serine/threonine protein kinase [Moorena sp. SIO3C2]
MSLCINPNCSNPRNPDSKLFCQSCNSELLLEGRYRVISQLGNGGFGKTYEIVDPQGNPRVLKVLIKNSPKYIELFQREAEVLGRLENSGIPKVEPDAYFTVYPRNSDEPVHCLVMEKIEGLNLKQYIQKRGAPIDQKIAIRWLIQLATILQAVHSHNFFHRDIKPSNIMLRTDGQLVLIDFGTAREITGTFVTKKATGMVTGVVSAGYTPLEQLNGQAVPQSDFFALGRTFVYLLTGQDPSKFYESYNDELSWRDSVPNILPQLADFLDYLMARLPNQRPQTAKEIYQQLVDINNALYPTKIPFHSKTSQASKETKSHHSRISNGSSPRRPASTTQPWVSPTPLPISSAPNRHSNLLDPNFVALCQQELAELIGPMATIVCQRTLVQNPNSSAQEFVKALSQQIPNQKYAQDFQRRLLSSGQL